MPRGARRFGDVIATSSKRGTNLLRREPRSIALIQNAFRSTWRLRSQESSRESPREAVGAARGIEDVSRSHDSREARHRWRLPMGKTKRSSLVALGTDPAQMTARYRHQARTWEQMGLGVLASLHQAIPELAKAGAELLRRSPHGTLARVAELADAVDLGSTVERRRGSSPLPCTSSEISRPSVGFANSPVGVDFGEDPPGIPHPRAISRSGRRPNRSSWTVRA